ncbi:MAG: RNA-binding transcriptional accessory protein [Planctomycetes bacterium]|nr:RNA-binding transcriptional accessory protein [Planctomycetota bacterium]
MNALHISKIALELGMAEQQVLATAELLGEGGTVPFISRYRKERTGGLDEVAITAIRDRLAQLKELDARRDTILKTIADQGKLTDELKSKIEAAETLTVLEDLYLPYKPKRRTRATIAKEKGLESLALRVFEQTPDLDPQAEAVAYVDAEKGVPSVDDALAGARDIMAEWIAEDAQARERIRELYMLRGMYECKVIKGKEQDGFKYENYFDWSEPVTKVPSHRILAMRRGEKEGFLRLRTTVTEQEALCGLEGLFLKEPCASTDEVKTAIADCLKRLLAPSIETEVRLGSKKKAEVEAIRVFAENLRQLLLASPLGQKAVLALDPGFRTGCKLVCLDRQGKLLHDDVVYPHSGAGKAAVAAETVKSLVDRYEIEAIAIGNGTASRETEAFVKKIELTRKVAVVMVNESGASVYSASDVAREEFPSKDLTVRGAVSIGRRLTDPLAELVKIDPKSIGVGQYQHDVDQSLLRQGLDDVVVSCVNSVGVELNTASKQLLTYVSGLGPQLAQNIVAYRDEHGAFASRKAICKVPRLGAKAFEQAGGFLRIRDAANPLDRSAVHPERYAIVDTMASDVGCSLAELMTDPAKRQKIQLDRYVTDEVGLPTLNDIMGELSKPGRDPRQQFELFEFAAGIEKIEHVESGMTLPGIVTNITAFGAFVDIGVHQDGLVHVSEMSHHFVKDPNEVVKVHQKVTVTIKEVDVAKKRISLSMKSGEPAPVRTRSTEKPVNRPVKRQARPASKKTPPKARKDPNEPLGDRLHINWS